MGDKRGGGGVADYRLKLSAVFCNCCRIGASSSSHLLSALFIWWESLLLAAAPPTHTHAHHLNDHINTRSTALVLALLNARARQSCVCYHMLSCARLETHAHSSGVLQRPDSNGQCSWGFQNLSSCPLCRAQLHSFSLPNNSTLMLIHMNLTLFVFSALSS